MTFDPQKHLSMLKTKQGPKDYLPVQWRLVWFREVCSSGTIETELVHLDTEKKLAVFKAIAADGNGALAMGHGSECEKDFQDYIEKAETKAIGRALAALGFGTQFTGDELDEGERIVDAPVDQKSASRPESEPTPIVESMQDLKTKCRNRAYKLGVQSIAQYNSFCHKVIGKAEPETLADITAINAACERQEKKAS